MDVLLDGSLDGLLHLNLERNTIDGYFGNIAFYFFDLYFVVDPLNFIFVRIHNCYILVHFECLGLMVIMPLSMSWASS